MPTRPLRSPVSVVQAFDMWYGLDGLCPRPALIHPALHAGVEQEDVSERHQGSSQVRGCGWSALQQLCCVGCVELPT